MRALVTGATGFLGMAICKRLLQHGYSLRCQYRTESKLHALQAYLEGAGGTAVDANSSVVANSDSSTAHSTDLAGAARGVGSSATDEKNIDGTVGSSSSLTTADDAASHDNSETATGDNTPTIEYIQQDLVTASQSAIVSMIKGCSVVIHNAASVKDYGSYKAAVATNVGTTERIFTQAANLNIDRFVYISSIAVHGLKSAEHITEAGPYNRLYNIYAKTKKRAELTIQSIAEQQNYHNYVIIRPGSIYGAGDHTTYYKIFDAIGNHRLPYAGTKRGIVPLIHKDDVAGAVLCALGPDPAICKQAYNIVSGERVEFAELFDYIARQLSVPPPSIVIPRVVAFTVCVLVTLIRKIPLVNFEPITMFRVRSMLSKRTFNNTKLKEILHFTPSMDWKRGFEESISQYLDSKLSQ